MPRSSSKDATKTPKKRVNRGDSIPENKRKIKAQNAHSADDSAYIQHRPTTGPIPLMVASSPMARIGQGFFNRTYSDVISHCRKLSACDDE